MRLAAGRVRKELSKALDDPNSTDWVATAKRCLLLLQTPPRKARRDPLRAERRVHVRELDAMCREIVFARDGNKCRSCGRSEGLLDWAHILSRRHPKTRHDPENSLVLCRACHMSFHDRAKKGWEIIVSTIGQGQYAILESRARGPGKTNLGLTRLHLIQEAKKYGLKL